MIDEELKFQTNGLYINESMSHLYKLLEDDSHLCFFIKF